MYKVECRFWIDSEKGAFLGKGRIDLLKKIRDTGSISQAAKAMEMSYKQAWMLIKSMNDKAKEPVVEKVIGGKGGGGAQLTREGEKMIKLFEELEKEVLAFMQEKSEKLGV